jgi:hypothetical protein
MKDTIIDSRTILRKNQQINPGISQMVRLDIKLI